MLGKARRFTSRWRPAGSYDTEDLHGLKSRANYRDRRTRSNKHCALPKMSALAEFALVRAGGTPAGRGSVQRREMWGNQID